MNNLTLLVIDLGDSCVVKVESLEKEFWLHLSNESDYADAVCPLTSEGQVKLFQYPFPVVRAAIDRLGGEPPVPRIQGNFGDGYGLIVKDLSVSYLSEQDYEALCGIIGHPLPVYTPNRGEWEKFSVSTAGLVDIWRYTLGVK